MDVGLAPVDDAVIVVVKVGPGQAPGAVVIKPVVIDPVDSAVIVRIQFHPLPATVRIQVGRPVDIAIIVQVEIGPGQDPGAVVINRVVIDPVGYAVTVGVELDPVNGTVIVVIEPGPGFLWRGCHGPLSSPYSGFRVKTICHIPEGGVAVS